MTQNRETLLALADRCEKSTGGDRELDADIATAFNLKQLTYRAGEWLKDPEFSASLDAAMTLVPEGWFLRQMNFSAPCADDRKWHLNLHGGSVGQDTFVGRGATPALALCAAALRATASSLEVGK